MYEGRSVETKKQLHAMYVIKANITDTGARAFAFRAQKTMYGGRRIAAGDTVFIFASENEGGEGLIARGVVISARAIARKPHLERQTPRVSIHVARTATARRRLGRTGLRPFSNWNDGRPESELNFKFYRQATNKIGAISGDAAEFLEGFFSSRPTAKPNRSRATRRASGRQR